jgi:hypothetical protein
MSDLVKLILGVLIGINILNCCQHREIKKYLDSLDYDDE